MADFLNLNFSDIATRENQYLNSEFGVDWSAMGLNNVSNVYQQSDGTLNNYTGTSTNALTQTLGNNWLGSLSSVIGSGISLFGAYKSYKSYKSLNFEDYKNESALMSIDSDREQTLASLLNNNSLILQEAGNMINYNAYAQAMENSQNQVYNQQAYSNSIFNVSRQVQAKTNQMYRDIKTLDLNTASAKNAELTRQKSEFLATQQAAFNSYRQTLNNTISQIQNYASQLERLPVFNRSDNLSVDTSINDNFVDPTAQQYATVQNKLLSLKTDGFQLTQNYLSQGNKVLLGTFSASLPAQYERSSSLTSGNLRVPNLSEVYFDF